MTEPLLDEIDEIIAERDQALAENERLRAEAAIGKAMVALSGAALAERVKKLERVAELAKPYFQDSFDFNKLDNLALLRKALAELEDKP